ncbi:MAG: M20/M25/M40 family metallo-hydrolase [Planctomycetota bacterium]
MSRLRRALPLLLTLFLLPLPVLARDADVDDLGKVLKQGVKDITSKDARKHIVYLAGPECEGRASGEPGCDVAAEYLAKKLGEMGLVPGGDGETFRQKFHVNAGPFRGQRPKDERPTGRQPTYNVIGILEGAHAERAKETIVLGAHYDHIGHLDRKKMKVFWGADDNASGTAGVLLVAGAFAKAGMRPDRTIVFVLFSGEERGLHGSDHYVKHPARPLADTVTMLNFDMLGRNDASRMDVYGSRSSPELSEANLRLARAAKFKFRLEGGSVFQRSDHFRFYQRDIPVLFFNSGMHGDLHALGDEPKKINFKKVERIAEHAWRLIWEIANRETRPTFKKIPPEGAAGILMFVPDQMSIDEAKELGLPKKKGGVRVRTVDAGGAGAEAGLQAGDVIFGLAGKYLDDKNPLKDLDRIADKLKVGQKASLLVLRDGRPKKLSVTRRDEDS